MIQKYAAKSKMKNILMVDQAVKPFVHFWTNHVSSRTLHQSRLAIVSPVTPEKQTNMELVFQSLNVDFKNQLSMILNFIINKKYFNKNTNLIGYLQIGVTTI